MKVASGILTFSLAVSAFAQASRSAGPAATPRSQPRAPVGPGTANNPAVVVAPPTVGQTFQRPLIGGPPASATPIDPAASVPTTTFGNTPVVPNSIADSALGLGAFSNP